MSKEMFMIEELVKEMALILIDEKGMSMMDALDCIVKVRHMCTSILTMNSVPEV